MNPKVDAFLIDGCGRCSFYKTEHCKVHTWVEEVKFLRSIALDCGLTEEFKWSQPCYTYEGKNVMIATAFKEYASLSFFKGSLLKDKGKLLFAPGESSQSLRQLRFTSVQEINEIKSTIREYIHEAIEVDRAGLKVNFKKNPEPIPIELQEKLDQDNSFKKAFESLTPGRQRGYIIHFSQPKQTKTRVSRIEKCIPKILNGEGMNDNYNSMRKKS